MKCSTFATAGLKIGMHVLGAIKRYSTQAHCRVINQWILGKNLLSWLELYSCTSTHKYSMNTVIGILDEASPHFDFAVHCSAALRLARSPS